MPQMRKLYDKLRRRRAILAIPSLGQDLRERQRQRGSIDPALWPDDHDYLTAEIERIEAVMERHRDTIRNTAYLA